jgi:hypothetical protein
MAVNLPDVLTKLLELYPDVDEDMLAKAFMKAAQESSALRESLDRVTFATILPIATKRAKSEPLTKMEKAMCKLLDERRGANSFNVAS